MSRTEQHITRNIHWNKFQLQHVIAGLPPLAVLQ